MLPGAVLDELIAVLAAEARECRRLLPLLEEQERALVHADAPAIALILRQQEPIARRLVELEQGRQRLVRGLGDSLGLRDTAPVTLSTLIERFPGPAPRLAGLRDELRAVVTRLGRLSRRNGFLVERSIGHVERLFNHLMSAIALTAAPTYAATGRTARPVPALRYLDRSA